MTCKNSNGSNFPKNKYPGFFLRAPTIKINAQRETFGQRLTSLVPFFTTMLLTTNPSRIFAFKVAETVKLAYVQYFSIKTYNYYFISNLNVIFLKTGYPKMLSGILLKNLQKISRFNCPKLSLIFVQHMLNAILDLKV